MLNDAKDLQAVYIVCGYTDLRKGIDSLSNIVNGKSVLPFTMMPPYLTT